MAAAEEERSSSGSRRRRHAVRGAARTPGSSALDGTGHGHTAHGRSGTAAASEPRAAAIRVCVKGIKR